MKRIGLTQRVADSIGGHEHDCLDTRWADTLLALGYVAVPLPNFEASVEDTHQILDGFNLHGLILTGGNDLVGLGPAVGSAASPRRDAFERIAIGWVREKGIPLLAVCRGFQHLNKVLGGGLSKNSEHAGRDHKNFRIARATKASVEFPDEFSVNSYHNFVIPNDELADELVPLVADKAGCIEAAEHFSEPILGMMWHPERPNPAAHIDYRLLKSLFGL